MTLSAGTRALTIVGLGAVLSACSPPNEQPSDVKVDTATAFAAPTPTSSTPTGRPGVIDCVGTPEFEPDTLALTCADDDDRLVDITWDSWTSSSATGTATRQTGPRSRDATVTLSDPVQGPQGLVFTSLAVDGRTIIL